MSRGPNDFFRPRLLVIDDERQIHASLRLRLSADYHLSFCVSAKEGLLAVSARQFDLCFVDIHMPDKDGLKFIEEAAEVDGDLGFVIISAFDSDENLHRAIPLQVYEFIGKPLPEREGFEARIPDWIARTRQRRREHALAKRAHEISRDLESARIEREVELVASESARDALQQTAGLLTTIHAHLVSSTTTLASRARSDPSLSLLYRSLDEARKTADAAVNVAEMFLGSGYGNRESSPALIDVGLKHAASIASRSLHAAAGNRVDYTAIHSGQPIRGLTGIDFLMMMIPILEAALTTAPSESTVRVTSEPVSRLDAAMTDLRFRSCLWFNRRQSAGAVPGILIVVSGPGNALSEDAAEGWLRGESTLASNLTSRGLVKGAQKGKGLVGVAVQPAARQFMLVLALPV